MGNVLAPMIGPVLVPVIGAVLAPMIGLAAILLTCAFRPADRENPTLAHIQARHEAEQAREQAEQAARVAQERAQQIQRRAEQDGIQARVRQEEATQAAARATEEVKRMKAQMEEVASAARRAQEVTEVAANTAREEAAKLARESEEARKRSKKIRKDAERAAAAAKGKAKKAQKAADEQRRKAEASKTRAEEAARKAAEETRKANVAKEEAERRLKEGIRPVVTPTPAELAAAKRRVQYREDRFHFAVAGISGSGKSSLVNAFRGLTGRDAGAAAVGVTETTLEMARYLDANPENPFVWYDLPGAGTIKCRDWQYFNEQGLYVFDCILVLFDNRFTMTDIAILVNARRYNIPTYIIRSKADQHIRNIMIDMGYDSEGGDEKEVERRDELRKAARKIFIEETRKTVQTNLKDANLPDQRVYIVSNNSLLDILLRKMSKKTIDEVDLLNDLVNQVYRKRVSQ
ncbi:P-loop containing nucleoside triphosphate hydrolase protein [Butyriboletus roseoflavus]|nr:P-loop containing nucleoside triphosphate hydrolase protein [Butyriboletus roseoflavus]